MFAEAGELVGRFHVQLPDVPIRATYNAAPGQELLTITDPGVLTLSRWALCRHGQLDARA